MTANVISELVNLNRYPKSGLPFDSVDVAVAAGQKIHDGAHNTLGDLHGNALALIHFLIEKQVIIGLSTKQYRNLRDAYQTLYDASCKLAKSTKQTESGTMLQINGVKPDALNDALVAVETILDDATWRVPKGFSLRLLGDLFCDRGASDLLTLLVLTKMQASEIPFEVIFSNHDFDFLLNLHLLDENLVYSGSLPGYKSGGRCGKSYLNLLMFKQAGYILTKQILEMVELSYIPNLKLMVPIEYKNAKNQTISHVLTHAPIDQRLKDDLATLWCPGHKRGKLHKEKYFYQAIDKLNVVFDRKKSNLIEFSKELLQHRSDKKSPLRKFVWIRLDETLSRKPYKLNRDFFIKYRHGHDTDDDATKELNQRSNIEYIGLDNKLGKGDNMQETLPYIESDNEESDEFESSNHAVALV